MFNIGSWERDDWYLSEKTQTRFDTTTLAYYNNGLKPKIILILCSLSTDIHFKLEQVMFSWIEQCKWHKLRGLLHNENLIGDNDNGIHGNEDENDIAQWETTGEPLILDYPF